MSSMSQGSTAQASVEEIAAAIGRIPSGLFVVTWLDPAGGGDRGMLASWVMQAGFDPPAISLAVAPSRGLAAAIDAGAPFVVNLLSESQRSMVGRFGRPATPARDGRGGGGYDPFEGLAVERSPCGAAILSPGSGWLECVGAGGITGTDHRIVVAVVRAAGCVVMQPDGCVVMQPDGCVVRPESGAAAFPVSPDDPPIVHLRKNGLRY